MVQSTSVRSSKPFGNLIVMIGLALLVEQCLGQTFHYSHGWTNGKRSGMAPPIVPENAYKSDGGDLAYLLNEMGPLRPVNVPSPLVLVPITDGGRIAYKLFTIDPEKSNNDN